jgi:ribosomal protein S5
MHEHTQRRNRKDEVTREGKRLRFNALAIVVVDMNQGYGKGRTRERERYVWYSNTYYILNMNNIYST